LKVFCGSLFSLVEWGGGFWGSWGGFNKGVCVRYWVMVFVFVVAWVGLGFDVGVFAGEVAGTQPAAGEPAAKLGPWVEREVRFKSPDGVELVGTVVAPDGEVLAGAFVLLIQGSGPTDRDGNQLPGLRTDLLKGLAHALGDAGVGSLRVDSRACGSMKKSWPAKPEEVAGFFALSKMLGDVEAAWKVMGELPEAKGKKRVVLGHSQGGVFALALERVIKPDGLVLMATPGRVSDEVIDDQLRTLMTQQGADAKTREWYLRENMRLMREIRETGKATHVPMGLAGLYNASSMLFLKEYSILNPAELAAGTQCPVLVVQGTMDKQVNVVKDAGPIVTALDKRSVGKCQTVFVAGGSHNFKKVKTMDEDGLNGEVMGEAREGVVKWVLGVASK
jgi:uncharacterized protein